LKTFPRIVFFGTPEFAVASLKSIIEAGYSMAGVVTVPDRPAGRGLKEKRSPVKEFALLNGIPLAQPVSLRDPGFLEQLRVWNPDLQVVVAFRILPESIFGMPRLGTFNLHASLLPQYRGAAPINWAIINGETETGLTTFFLERFVDTGMIIFSEKVGILPDDTAGTLHDRMKEAGAELVVRTIEAIASGPVPAISQANLVKDTLLLKPAPKITKEDCLIDWNRKTQEVHNRVRGLSPYPGAFAELETVKGMRLTLKIFSGIPEYTETPGKPGEIVTDGKNYLKVSCTDGYFYLTSVQSPGRNPMVITEFLKGNFRVYFPDH
jgi:methionyl-tRNA formyltransferase